MSRNQILETLAALGAGAIILTGCAGSPEPVKGTDVPAASGTPSATPEPSGQPAAADTGAPKTSDAKGTPSATPSAMASATPTAMPMAKDMPKGNKTQKVRDSKRAKACQGGCGEGTCGGC